MSSNGMDHAVVVGGSFAGLVTARVLSDHFAQVTILERDQFPVEPIPRKGVPQGGHVHGILKLGREILDDLLPGFVAETTDEGAILFDQIAWGAGWGPNGWSTARGPSKALGYGVRRPLLEAVARRRVSAIPNIGLAHHKAQGLATSAGRVTGVLIGDDTGAATVLEADLVVDASGRGSAGPAWLEQAGFEAPTDTIVNAFGGYASKLLRVPDDAWRGDFRFVAQLPTPTCTKGAIVYPQDNGLYIVSLFGQARDYPPGDEAGFDDFLQNCEISLMHEVVSKSESASEIRTSRATANRWRHYERIADPPPGFVALGDASMTANPMFGQGISTACLGAVTLGDTIGDLEGDLRTLPKKFQGTLAERIQFPWQLAVGFDFQFPETVGERPALTPEAKEAGQYLRVLGQIATEDREVNEAMLLSTQMYDRSRLFEPDFQAKAKAWVAEGRAPRYTDPKSPPPTLVH